MKKLFALFLIALLAFGGAVTVMAEQPTSDNYEIFGQGGAIGISAPTKVVNVRYAMSSANSHSLQSGDCVIWSTNSHDGITISACVTSNDPAFAGVLVTSILTAEGSGNSVSRNDRNWGKMAISGYCLVKATLGSTAGRQLVPSGASSPTNSAMTTADDLSVLTTTAVWLSSDTGVLLAAPASNGALAPCNLN